MFTEKKDRRKKTMMSVNEVRELALSGNFRRIPVSRELYADRITAIEVLRILRGVSKHCYLLESVEDAKRWGRYTFLGYDPVLELTCKNGNLVIRSREGKQEAKVSHPGEEIRKILKEYQSPRIAGMPTFTGGFVGYFSYDYIMYAEPSIKLDGRDEEGFQDVDLMLFDKVIAFDHFRQKLILIANVDVKNLAESYPQAVSQLEEMERLIRHGERMPEKRLRLTSPLRPLFTREEYCRMVERGKDYIREGDIFQVVLSNRFDADMEGSLLDAYRVLRTTNPSPYMFYFTSDAIEIAGASPETLVKLTEGKLSTFPLAGTRPRGKTGEEDAQMEKELLADEKERAEHNMLVDLGRNDIGKISVIGSVKVERYMEIEKYSHVMHIGSMVTGQIKDGLDGLDAVDAVLPAGTLSGAPKIRACEIIHELEKNKRGIYGGAIGYLDFSGNLDVCIAIRLAFAKNGKVFVRSGAGIVADSVPEKEYEECLNKARAVFDALETAQKGDEL